MRMHHPDGQVFSFDAGALSLELACTTGGEGFRARFEILHTPDDLGPWVARTRLAIPAAAVRATAAELESLKDLREAVWAGAYALATGGTVETAVINERAAGTPPVPRIAPDGTRTWQEPVTGAQIAAAIARDAVVTFTPPASGRVRMCGGDTCALIYLDTSRPGTRRWCSMDRCGNRAKVRGHRQRQEAP